MKRCDFIGHKYIKQTDTTERKVIEGNSVHTWIEICERCGAWKVGGKSYPNDFELLGERK